MYSCHAENDLGSSSTDIELYKMATDDDDDDEDSASGATSHLGSDNFRHASAIALFFISFLFYA